MGIERTGHLNPPSPCGRELEGGVHCTPSPRPSPTRGEGASDDEAMLAAAFKVLAPALSSLVAISSAVRRFTDSGGSAVAMFPEGDAVAEEVLGEIKRLGFLYEHEVDYQITVFLEAVEVKRRNRDPMVYLQPDNQYMRDTRPRIMRYIEQHRSIEVWRDNEGLAMFLSADKIEDKDFADSIPPILERFDATKSDKGALETILLQLYEGVVKNARRLFNRENHRDWARAVGIIADIFVETGILREKIDIEDVYDHLVNSEMLAPKERILGDLLSFCHEAIDEFRRLLLLKSIGHRLDAGQTCDDDVKKFNEILLNVVKWEPENSKLHEIAQGLISGETNTNSLAVAARERWFKWEKAMRTTTDIDMDLLRGNMERLNEIAERAKSRERTSRESRRLP